MLASQLREATAALWGDRLRASDGKPQNGSPLSGALSLFAQLDTQRHTWALNQRHEPV